MQKILIAAGLAMMIAAGTAQAQDPPGLFDERNDYNMQVACPLWGPAPLVNEDPARLLICIQALSIKVEKAEVDRERLREQIERLERLVEALGKDLNSLWAWSHCHGTQAECAALRR